MPCRRYFRIMTRSSSLPPSTLGCPRAHIRRDVSIYRSRHENSFHAACCPKSRRPRGSLRFFPVSDLGLDCHSSGPYWPLFRRVSQSVHGKLVGFDPALQRPTHEPSSTKRWPRLSCCRHGSWCPPPNLL